MMHRKLSLAVILAVSFVLQGCAPLLVTGAAAGALMATDRRSSGMYLEDENIEWRVFARLRGDFTGAHVNATSYNRRVLLTGEVPNEEVKAQVEKAVRGVLNVRDVVNELQVAGASSLASRGNDALVTSNVKARMVNNGGRFSVTHVKVLTEAGTVYLMGLVNPSEADAAVEVARGAAGVSRVVKVFEYVN